MAYCQAAGLVDQTGVLEISEKSHENDTSQEDERFMGVGGILDIDTPGDGNHPPPPYDPPPYSAEELADVDEIKYPPPQFSVAPAKLSCPVIIPQRRPGSKGRGFMRAYAPVLADYDIKDEYFLTFLKSFHKASMVSTTLRLCHYVRDREAGNLIVYRLHRSSMSSQ